MAKGRQLLLSCHNQNVEVVEKLLGSGADLEYAEKDGITALTIANHYGNQYLIKLLSSKRALTNTVDDLENSAVADNLHLVRESLTPFLSVTLHTCCRCNLVNWAEQLINVGVDIDTVDIEGYTALYYACTMGHVECIKLLLSHNADVEVPCKLGRTALHASVGWPWYPLVSRPVSGKFTQAIRSSDMKTIKYLHSIGMEYDCEGNHMLVEAARWSSEEVIATVLSLGVYVDSTNNDGSTALMWAAHYNRLDTVRLLAVTANLKAIDNNGCTALAYAGIRHNLDMLRLLLSYDPRFDLPCVTYEMSHNSGFDELALPELSSDEHSFVQPSETDPLINPTSLACLLHYACQLNDLQAVRLLLTNPEVEVDIRDGHLRTPLTVVAMFHQNMEMARELLKRGACAHQRNDVDMSPLHYAAQKINKPLLDLLYYSLDKRIMPVGEYRAGKTTLVNSMATWTSFAYSVVPDKNNFEDVHKCGHFIASTLLYGGTTEQDLCDLSTGSISIAPAQWKKWRDALDSSRVISISVVQSACDYTADELSSVAVRDLRFDFVLSLLKTGKYNINDANEQGDTIQMYCCRRSLHKIVELTIELEANPELANNNGETALTLSVGKSWWRTISGPSYDKLWDAIKKSDLDEIRRLVKVGVDLNVCNAQGEYPLFAAIESASVETVSLMISCKAKVNMKNKSLPPYNSMTPLLFAAWCGFADIIAILMDAGAVLTEKDNQGNTFIHLLAEKGHIEALKVGIYKALKTNAALVMDLVNVRNDENLTPIMCAAKGVFKECVDFLSAAGSVSDPGYLSEEAELAKAEAASVAAAKAASRIQEVDSTGLMEVVTSPKSGDASANAAVTPKEAEVVPPPDAVPIQKMLKRSDIEKLYHSCKFGLTEMVKTQLVNFDFSKINNKVEEINYVMVKNKLTEVITSETSLYVSCYYGHTDIVRVLLDKTSNPNISARNGWSCLFVAAKKGYLDIVKMLIAKGADVRAKNRNDMTPLNIAAYGGYLEIVFELVAQELKTHLTYLKQNGNLENSVHVTIRRSKSRQEADMILEQNPNLTLVTSDGFTPLYVALVSENMKIRQQCLEFMNQGDKMLARPLHAAIQSGKFEVANFLLKCGADVNGATRSGITPLYVASYSGNENMVQMFLDYVPPSCFPALNRVDVNAVNKEGLTPVTVAAFNGHTSIVEKLLAAGAELSKTDKKGVNALYAACQNGHIEVVKLLLSHNADPNSVIGNKNTPVHAAAIENKHEILNLLMSHGALMDVMNNDGVTPLYMACEKGHIEALTMLIEGGADVNTPNKHTVSPLNIASQNGHKAVVKKLIDCGADVNSQTADGPTPLFISSQNGHLEICKMLLEAKAEVDTQTKEKETALFVAGYFGYSEIVKELINFKANVNIVDRDSRTPLWWACKAGQEQIVKLLMDAGADVNISDREHVTPMMIAAQQGKNGVCELLNAARSQATLCCICLTNQRCVLFLPCKHLASCADCSLKLERSQSKKCPICRDAVTESVNVFT